MHANEPADDDKSLAAAAIAQHLVINSRAHVFTVLRELNGPLKNAAGSTPHGMDRAAAQAETHLQAYSSRVSHVESASNALLTHLRGLEAILADDTFYPLPAIAVCRAIAETAASCAWLVSGASVEERAARAYATIFRDIDKGIQTVPTRAQNLTELREKFITQLASERVRVQRVVRDEVTTDQVDVVLVGRARAKVGFKHSHRVAAEIPAIAGLYSGMSGVVHGESLPVMSALETPAPSARMIAVVTIRSVEAWSNAIHRWVGIPPARFYTDADYGMLVSTIPQRLRDEFMQQ